MSTAQPKPSRVVVNHDNTHVLGQSIFMKKNETKVLHPTVFFYLLLFWSFHNIVCVVMIHHDAAWLCPGRTRLYINYLGKVYGKNALDFHFWNPDHVTGMTSPLSSIMQVFSWVFCPGGVGGTRPLFARSAHAQVGCVHGLLVLCVCRVVTGPSAVAVATEAIGIALNGDENSRSPSSEAVSL